MGAAASVAWFVTAGSPAVVRSGAANTAERTTLSVGKARLVAEPGTMLTWTSSDRGVRVEQRSGNVFYRVEPGRPFVVVTDVGELSALGTCFRVEVSAMKLPKQGLVGGAIGAVVTAGVFVAVFEGKVSLANDRGRVEIAAGQSAQIAPGGDAKAGPPAMTSTNVVRLASGAQPAEHIEPVASGAAATAASKVTRAGDSAFAREVRDSQWATAQEQAIRERLQKYIGISPDRIELECRTKCCRARLSKALYDEHARELQSSVGLGGGKDESSYLYGDDEAGEMVVAQVCFRRTDGRDPDRGAEREALLSTIRPELVSCARGIAHEVVISIELTLDESGAVTKVDTRSDPTGEPAAACVERAVVGAAAFASASEVSLVPVNVTLPLR